MPAIRFNKAFALLGPNPAAAEDADEDKGDNNERDWADLDSDTRAAAELLGWDGAMWDAAETLPIACVQQPQGLSALALVALWHLVLHTLANSDISRIVSGVGITATS